MCYRNDRADIHAQVNLSEEVAHNCQQGTLVVYNGFSMRSG